MTLSNQKTPGKYSPFILALLRYRPGLLIVVFLLMLARSLSEGATLMLLVPLLSLTDAAQGAQLPQGFGWVLSVLPSHPSISLVLALFLCVTLLRAGLGYASAMASSVLRAGLTDHERQQVYLAFSRASWLHLAGARQAQDMRALTTQSECVGIATSYVLNIAAGCLTILIGLILALALSPLLTVTVAAIGAGLALPMIAFQRWAYKLGASTVKAMQALFDVLIARMNGLKLAKAFAIERILEADFAASSTLLRRTVVAAQENLARASLLQEVAAAVLLAVLVYVALGPLKAPGLDLILLIMIFARLVPLAQGIQSGLRSLAGILPDYVSLHERIAFARAAAEPLPKPSAPIALRHSLALSGVTFSYPNSTRAPILHDISLVLAARSATGILGLSGAGKSTLADIIAGLIPPDCGRVLIDGIPLDAKSRMQWRASVAYVTQDAPLFNDTLRENLRVGARYASDAEIWACLDIVQAAELARRLPDGLETLAGDRGVRFSAGERQRFRLASALLRRPQLLILDESTNALSQADEEPILAALKRLCDKMTILLIAHRSSSVRWTHRLLVVQNGRTVADGAPSDVLGRISLPPHGHSNPAPLAMPFNALSELSTD